MLIRDIRDALVIREQGTFLLTDILGNVPADNPSGFGLYHSDTRYLSVYDFSFAKTRPVVLLSTAELGFSEEQVLTNPAMSSIGGRTLPRGSVEAWRQRVVDDGLEETLRVTNYNVFPVDLDVVYAFDADFDDIFEVRGAKRERRGEVLPPRIDDSTITFAYQGLDKRRRETTITFSPTPLSIEEGVVVTFRLHLEHRESAVVRIMIATDGHSKAPRSGERFVAISSLYQQWRESGTQVFTSNEFFNAALERSFSDLRMLWSDADGHSYPAAGTPWYDTFFGRDSAIASIQTLAYRPDIAAAASSCSPTGRARMWTPGETRSRARSCTSGARTR